MIINKVSGLHFVYRSEGILCWVAASCESVGGEEQFAYYCMVNIVCSDGKYGQIPHAFVLDIFSFR